MQQQPGPNMAQAPVVSTLTMQPTYASKQPHAQSQSAAHAPFHQMNHQKNFNVVTLLKTTTAHQMNHQQQQHHQNHQQQHHQQQNQQQSHHASQSYTNAMNRATVHCTPTATPPPTQPVICQLNSTATTGTGSLCALNQRLGNNIDSSNGGGIGLCTLNQRLANNIDSSNGGGIGLCTLNQRLGNNIDSSNGGGIGLCTLNQRLGNNIDSSNGGAINNSSNINMNPGGNGGIVGINVGCIDNRKYEYKNKLLNNNFQTAQEVRALVPTEDYRATGGNPNAGGGTVRTNQQATQIYTGLAPNSVPRSTAGNRHMPNSVPIQTMFPTTNMVLQNFQAYPQRQPFPGQTFAFAPQPHPYYPLHIFQTASLPQTQTHNRGAVGVTTNAGVGTPMSAVQAGPHGGSLAGGGASGAEMAAAVKTMTANTNLSTASALYTVTSVNTAPQVGIGVGGSVAGGPGMVGVQQHPQKVRRHALPIIDPVTKKSIFEESDTTKKTSNSENDYQNSASTTAVIQSESNLSYPVDFHHQQTLHQHKSGDISNVSSNSGVTIMPSSDTTSRTSTHSLDLHHVQLQQREMIGQTPVVSAMSDGPSVEIPPTQPKAPRSKKALVTATKEEALNGSKEEAQIAQQEVSNATQLTPPRAPQTVYDVGDLATINIDVSENNISNTTAISQQQTEGEKSAEVLSVTSAVLTKNETSPQPTELEKSKVSNMNAVDSVSTSAVLSPTNKHDESLTYKAVPATNNNNINKQAEMQKDSTKFEYEYEKTEQTEQNSNLTNICVLPATSAASATSSSSTLQDLAINNNNNNSVTDDIKSSATSTTTTNSTKDVQNGNIAQDTTSTAPFTPSSATLTCDETDRAATAKTTSLPTSTSPTRHEDKNFDNPAYIIPKRSEQQQECSEDNGSVGVQETEVESNKDVKETDTTVTSAPPRLQSLINYNEGQWSPENPTGKKQYDREQLLQLREAKASRVQPDLANTSILPHPNMMPTFARNSGNSGGGKRIQSMIMGGTGSHRGGDGMGGGNKQASMSGVNARNSTKGMIHVNLSLNQDVKLNETDNAWRPRVLQKGSGDDEKDPETKSQREKDELLRRVRGILNKLTPEKFDALVEEIMKLEIDTPDKMESVMILVFEKAVDEPNFSVSYAQLCQRLVNEVKAKENKSTEKGPKSQLAMFRNALLDKTEREFTQNVTQSATKQLKLQPIVDKIKNCTDPAEKAELEAQLEEEELKIRRRSGGTVRFIGELFKISMLTGKIIYSCVEQLLNPRSEDMLECLCKLLTTVGEKLEKTPISRQGANDGKTVFYNLDKFIGRMQSIASKAEGSEKISSRVRFMLLDVIDLRKNKWESKRNEAPKTMGQIEKETKSEQLSSQYLNYGGSVSTGPGLGALGQIGGGNLAGGKRGDRDDRGGGRYGADHRGYSGSHSQRSNNDTGSLRRQPMNNNNSGSSGHTNNSGSNDDQWQVQTRGGRQIVDSNKLEGLSINYDMGKKMGGASQFQWNNASRQAAALSSSSLAPTAPTNSFAALLSLEDRSTDSIDRDRSGQRNKGSYNKNSMERDRFESNRYGSNDRNIRSRTGSTQLSRENSSSRSGVGSQSGGVRSMNPSSTSSSSSNMQKSASHSKYTQQQMPPSRMAAGKQPGILSSVTGASAGKNFHAEQQRQSQQSVSLSSLAGTQGGHNVSLPVVFQEPMSADIKVIKPIITDMIECILNRGMSESSIEEAASCLDHLSNTQKLGLIYYILVDYLHLRDVSHLYRRYLAIVIANLIENKKLTVGHFKLAYENFCKRASDLIVDIPNLWSYIFQFCGPLITKELINIFDLWTDQLKNEETFYLGKNFLKAFLNYCTREIGPNFTRRMFKRLNVKWSDFMSEADVNDFITSNNFAYIEDDKKKPVIEIRNESKEVHLNQVVEHIKHLLKEGSNADFILDYINGNIVEIEKQFVRSLTTTLCEHAIKYDGSYKLESNIFQNVCIPVLFSCINLVEERELECLYGMQLLVHDLEHPRGLLCEMFVMLYEHDVIQPDSFLKWRDSKDQSAGKGVAVKGLNSFFNEIANGETSDDN